MRPMQFVGRKTRNAIIETRLRIGPVDDPAEREAERVADQVLRMPVHTLQRAPVSLQRCSQCAKAKSAEELCPTCAAKAMIHRDATTSTVPEVTPEVEASVGALRGGGQALAPEVRAFMEPRFGHDFSAVRVHTDTRAARTAADVGALAFTVGSDIAFGAGQYQPGTEGGRRLIAHELTHVAQQDTSGGYVRRVAYTEEEQEASMNNAISNSNHSLSAAIASISRLKLAMQQDVFPSSSFLFQATIEAARNWLKTSIDDENFSSTLDKAVSKMKQARNTKTYITHRVRDRDVCISDPYPIAYSYVFRPNLGIHCCDRFFNYGPHCQKDAITHELFHLVGCHHGEAGHPKAPSREEMSTNQALDSADNLAQLVAELTIGQTDACRQGR